MSIGAPHSPTREETSYLKQKAWDTYKETIEVAEDGSLTLSRELSPWSCVLIRNYETRIKNIIMARKIWIFLTSCSKGD